MFHLFVVMPIRQREYKNPIVAFGLNVVVVVIALLLVFLILLLEESLEEKVDQILKSSPERLKHGGRVCSDGVPLFQIFTDAGVPTTF